MPKYIDADTLKVTIESMIPAHYSGRIGFAEIAASEMAANIVGEIDKMPAADVEPVRNWIPVMERLPKPYANVILCRPDAADGKVIVEQGFYGGTDWWKVHGTRTKKVIAWMPLPEPPKLDGRLTDAG